MTTDATSIFLQKVIETHATGHAREHSYRPALKEYFEAVTGLKVINEPKRSEYGAPDFVFLKDKIVVAYAEAKDVTVSLDDIEKSEQMDRYYGYSNIILTNGLEFRFYRNASRYSDPVVLAKLESGVIHPSETGARLAEDTIRDFITESKEPIKSGSVLAKVMAGKARRIRDNVRKFLEAEDDARNGELLAVYGAIKKLLLADLDRTKFADLYAQTLVYGLFVARYYDETPDDFSRQEARDLVPASNPFLRHFFDHIAGPSFDARIEVIVRELCEEFTHADVQAIVHNYYKVDKDSSRDPIIHFYEDFLQEYDATERKKLGVFYTPLPVVRFIVRAVDDILKRDFGLPQGLADSSTTEILQETQGKKHKVAVHKVQVLDPATGTGTFLNEVILHIRKTFEGQEGRWASYVNTDLLPRLHGFELMMASYTIAHLKLSTTIEETGAKLRTRLGVYLTNSLEKSEEAQRTLFDVGFGKAITEESNQANRVKNELPIMVVMGNPPYSGVSSNETEHANRLVDKYKVEPGGMQKLQERKHWLNDDYVKFIALAEDMVAKNGEGIVGFITNHGYLDNPTFRGMRWHLMDTFDDIYVIDLHGNSKKKETAPDGGKDENVFNIQQGVAIMLAVKTGKKKKGALAQVRRFDLTGTRDNKFETLDSLSLSDSGWAELDVRKPLLAFLEGGSVDTEQEYKKGFGVSDFFIENTTGVVTARDGLVIGFARDELKKRIVAFCDETKSEQEVRATFFGSKKSGKYMPGDSRGWKLEKARGKIRTNEHEKYIYPISYRPFDSRFIYYSPDMVDWGRWNLMKNIAGKDNIGLITTRLQKENPGAFIARDIIGHKTFNAYDSNSIFPLFLYADDGTKVPNLKKEIVDAIEKIVGTASPEDIFDYIYAALHSPSYREKYKEFLKIDFPRVPYPKNKEQFEELAGLGAELRRLHLLESPKVRQCITTFPEVGSGAVEKTYPKYKEGKVHINAQQYFGGVPEVAWNFYIGGYQPAQKWLKDRVGRTLTNADIEHYQQMIVALSETARVMGEIDTVFVA